ncbi:MAG: hypothetical protein D6771_08715, partial [Zetaproteobacteria bacterium]
MKRKIWLGALLALVALAWVWWHKQALPDRFALWVKLPETLSEAPPRDRWARALDAPIASVHELAFVLRRAAEDERVMGVVLDLRRGLRGSPAALRELAAAVESLRARGKPVVAYLEAIGQGGLWLALHADQAVLHPMGTVSVQGVGIERWFVRDLLARVGVRAAVVRAGAYKSFAETFTRTSLSPQARAEAERITARAQAWLMGEFRRLRPRARWPEDTAYGWRQAAQAFADAIAQHGGWAEAAKAWGWVDALATAEALRAQLAERWKLGAKDWVAAERYAPELPEKGDLEIVALSGVLGAPGGVDGSEVARLIEKAAHSPRVRAIVVRCATGGGSALT